MNDNHYRQSTRWLALAVVLTLALGIESSAAVPQLINYQGRLTNSVGAPLDTTVTIDFTIYKDSLGTLDVWSETHSGVVIQNGLFQVLLGSVSPLSASVFNGSKRWLGVQLQGGSAPSEFVPIVSVAYAYHAKSADTATYATSGGSSGWVDDGGVVRLATESDYVGIGTTSPIENLTVAGDILAEDSLMGRRLRIGSKSEGGRLHLYGDSSSSILTAYSSYRGLFLEARNFDGLVTHQMVADPDGDGGGLLWVGRKPNVGGFYVDGNHAGTNSALASIGGESRSAIFDMSVSGDSSVMLPSGSISSIETRNEAGIAHSVRSSGSVTLDNTVKTILSRTCILPSSGYVLVIGTLYYDFWHTAGSGDQFQFGVSDAAGSFPSDQGFLRNYSPNWTTFNYQDFVTVQGYFLVDAGIQTFYLLGQAVTTASPWAGDAHLSVLFFPTSYNLVIGPDNSGNPEQAEIDARIEARVAAETEQLRKEFDAKLKAIEEDMKKQLDNGDK